MQEPRTVYDIYTGEDGRAVVHAWTNDNRDDGWCEEDASWELSFPTLDAALRVTGKSRQGCIARVVVRVNGRQVFADERQSSCPTANYSPTTSCCR